MARFMPFSTACFRANAREATVFPPPVGTVSVYMPLGACPAFRQVFRMSQRLLFNSFFGGNQGEIYACSLSKRTGRVS